MIQQVSKRYDTYRDSGIEWLGEIPEQWEISRIKEKGTVRGRVGWKALKADEYVDEGYIFLATPNIKYKEIDFKNVNYITYERYIESPEIMLSVGDILLAKDGSTLGTANIVVSLPSEATVNSSIAVIRLKKSVFNKYLFYQILSDFIQNKISLKKSGMGVPHLFQRDINNFFILLPPYTEQKAIADYLDSKTAQIDQQIDLLSKKLKHYGELKQALINETVTRGLDKTVPMKNSGVEWIGDIPAHWEVKRVKELGNLVLGKMLDNNQGTGKLLKSYLKSKNIGWLTVTDSDVEEMYFSPYEMKLYCLKQGDLLFSEGGEVGKTAYWNNEVEECYIQNSVHKFTVNKKNNSRYFLYLSFSAGQANYYDNIVNFVSIKHLTKEKLSRVVWLSPPLTEQKAIADYLDEKTAKIDGIVEAINGQIENLKELRKTLINNVVTGKIKVI